MKYNLLEFYFGNAFGIDKKKSFKRKILLLLLDFPTEKRVFFILPLLLLLRLPKKKDFVNKKYFDKTIPVKEKKRKKNLFMLFLRDTNERKN